MAGSVKLGGKLWNVVVYDSVTVWNEAYIYKLMGETGLDAYLVKAASEAKDEKELAIKLQSKLIGSLKLHELLAGFLLPLGSTEADWTPEMAAETAKFVGHLVDREDKETVYQLGFEVTRTFFLAGLALLKNSLKSSASPKLQGPSVVPSPTSTAAA